MMSVKSLGCTSRFKGSAYHGVFNNKCRHHDSTQLTTSENHNNVAAMAQRVGITRATAVGNFHGDSLALSIIILMKSVGGTEVMSVQVPRLQVALEGFRLSWS